MDKQLISKQIPLSSGWDVIVVGGGPAGCTAAAAASRLGAKTLVIEQTGALGGMGTQGLLPAWCPFSDGEKMIYRGLAEVVFNRASAFVPQNEPGKLDWVPIDTEGLKRVYDGIVTENGAEVLFHSFVCGVEKKSDREIDALIVGNKRGLTAYQAKTYVDATGDGDIAAWAGADFEIGEKGTGKLQLSTLCFHLDNVDSFYYPHTVRNFIHGGDPRSVIHDIMADPEFPSINHPHLCNNFVGPSTVGYNAGHLALDTLSPESVSRGMIAGRKLVSDYRNALAKHAPDAFGGAHIAATANLMGVREGRRIRGDYVLSWRDYVERRSFDDEIGRNSYFIDIHGGDSSITGEAQALLKEKGHCEKGESHGIPYRSLVPEKLDNLLLSGRCISSDRIVYGSVRVMPVCLVTGEAAGTAAGLAVKSGVLNLHHAEIAELRAELLKNGAYIK